MLSTSFIQERRFSAAQQIPNATASTATIVEPTGVPASMERHKKTPEQVRSPGESRGESAGTSPDSWRVKGRVSGYVP